MKTLGLFLVLASIPAMPQAALAPVGVQQFFDNTGVPLSGGTVTTYIAGTTTKLATYTDATGTIPASNPIVLDAGGFASIWLGSGSYKFVVKRADGTLVSTTDNISSVNAGLTGLANVWAQTQSFKQTNVARFADQYSGSDASVKINACITDVITGGGGTCDARGLGGAQTMSQQVNVGSPTSYLNHIGVALILPDSANWKWGLTDGTSCGIYQYSSTSIVGSQPGAGGTRMILDSLNGSTNMDSLYCTDSNPTGGGSYVRAEGFGLMNTGSGTFVNGLAHVQKTYDQSRFSNIFAYNPTGDVWHVEGTCCGTTFYNIHGISNGNTGGGHSLVFGLTGQNTSDTTIVASTFNAPGVGKYDIYMRGGFGTIGNHFISVYEEGNCINDLTTPANYLEDVLNTTFTGGVINTECAAGGAATKYGFEIHSRAVNLRGVTLTNTANAINDVFYTYTVPNTRWNAGNLGTVPDYSTGAWPNYPQLFANTFSTNKIANLADSAYTVNFAGGLTTGQQVNLKLCGWTGSLTCYWTIQNTGAPGSFRVTDSVNSLSMFELDPNGSAFLNSGNGANTICLNCSTNAGTGGFILKNGGATPSTIFTVSGTGITASASQTAIASAATIAPTNMYFHISGTTTINTITAPNACSGAATMCQITIIPDGLFSTGITGNIALSTTAVVSKALIMTYDPTTTKWYPSY